MSSQPDFILALPLGQAPSENNCQISFPGKFTGETQQRFGNRQVGMSALQVRQIEEELNHVETEVIYLVIPPTQALPISAPKPYTLAERWGLFVEEVQMRWHRVSNSFVSMGLALCMVGVVGYCAYMMKSAMGINLFSVQQLESFVPIPGFGR